MEFKRHVRPLATVLAMAVAGGCQWPAGAPSAGAADTSLAAVEGLDWSSQHVSSPALARARAARLARTVMAFPDSSPAWAGGLDLEALGAPAGDTVPNGSAVAFPIMTSALTNKLFFLSRSGLLLRVDRLQPASPVMLALGDTFSRTAVTLSPHCTRAYLVSDDGTFYVIDTVRMTVLAKRELGGAYGVAPALDRGASAPLDRHDEVYVAANDGSVHQFVLEPGATAGTVKVVSERRLAVADASGPAAGHRLAASAVAHQGVVYVGDQAGNFHVVDTRTPANSAVYYLGAPVNTPPVLAVQDGTYSVTDPAGTPKAVPYGQAVYAFVNAGASCAWVNLHDTSVTYSRALRIDDADPGRKYGYLLDYAFSTAGTTEVLAAVDGGNLNTEAPERPLPGYGAVRSNDYLVPAETNTYEENGEARGGPVMSYVRWKSERALAPGSLINNATLTLTAAFDQACRVPEIRTASPYAFNSLTPWRSDALAPASRPSVGDSAVGTFMSGGRGRQFLNTTFRKQKEYSWDVTPAFSAPQPHYALALAHNAGGDAVLWPEGPVGGGTGKKAKRDHQVEAVKFHNNPLNADDAAPRSKDQRPTLKLTIAAATLPTATLETPPVLDALNKRVYVFYTNALYALDFSSPAAWSDTDFDPASGEPIKHTLFNVAHYGDTAHGGATHWNGKRFVGNFTAPTVDLLGNAAYVLSRYPATDAERPGTWHYGVSKIALPLDPAADRRLPGTPTYPDVAGEAALSLVVDPVSKVGNGGGNVYFGLGDGKLYQVER